MSIQDWIGIFAEQIKETSILEWVAVFAAIAEALLAKKNNVLLYPSGIISTIIYIYLMADAKLYGESFLNLYYLVMSIYGWYHWLKRKNELPLPVAYATSAEWGMSAGIVAAGWLLFYLVLSKAHSAAPAWDAWVSATAWAGMWLLARRKIENWLLLNLSNLFAIPLLVYKKMPLTACLTLFLFIVAIFGFIEWRKIYRLQNTAQG